jgi:hypothetical protein
MKEPAPFFSGKQLATRRPLLRATLLRATLANRPRTRCRLGGRPKPPLGDGSAPAALKERVLLATVSYAYQNCNHYAVHRMVLAAASGSMGLAIISTRPTTTTAATFLSAATPTQRAGKYQTDTARSGWIDPTGQVARDPGEEETENREKTAKG